MTDPDGSIEGWIPTADGAVVVNEPQGTPAWFPVNDNPRDKATYDFSITVPQGITALANGVLRSSATSGGKTTWVWRERSPMAPLPRDGDQRQVQPLHRRPDRTGCRSTTRSTRRPTRRRLGRCSPWRRRSCRSSATSTAPTRSTRRAGSSIRSATSATRSRRRPSPIYAYVPDETTVVHELVAHVVRRRGHADRVARHLDPRGLRDVLRVDLERATRRRDRPADVRPPATPRRGSRGARRRRRSSGRRRCSRRRSTTAAA